MIRLTLLLSGSIWAAMNFAPELDEPVFTEQVAEIAPVEAPAPEVTRAALVSPVKVAAIAGEATSIPTAAITTEVAVVAILEPEAERLIWFVTGSRVNVRFGPSTQTEVMGKVLYGDAALVVSDLDADWVKIRIEGAGVEGYVMKRFMTDVDPLG